MPDHRESVSSSGDKAYKDPPSSSSDKDLESGERPDVEKNEATDKNPSNEQGDIEIVDWQGRDDPANP